MAVQRWAQRKLRDSPWLHEEVGVRMAQRLGWIKQQPLSWLDWEPVFGGIKAHHAVRQALPDAKVFLMAAHGASALAALGQDGSLPQTLWARLRGRQPSMARSDTRVGLVWANMGLHVTHQPQALLARWHHHLDTGGFLMFSCLGPDSLQELSSVHAQMGWAPPCHAFTDMHDWGDMLVHSGFAEPVMDSETITLTYSSATTLLADLRGLGRNLHGGRSATTRGRQWQSAWLEAVQKHMPRASNGQMRLTFEIIYGHAYKPLPRAKVAATSAVSLSDMREMLTASKRLPNA